MGIPSRDGTIKWAVVNAEQVRDTTRGVTLGVVVSFFDITDRKRAEAQIRNQLQHLNSLREIDTAILSSFGMRIGLDAVVSRTILELNVDAADILLLNPDSMQLEYRSGWGFDTKAIEHHTLQLGEGIAGLCARDGLPAYIHDLHEHASEFTRKALLYEEKFISYYCVPLIENVEVKGVLEVFHRSPLHPDPDWINFLHTLAGQAAIAVQSATLFNGLQRSNTELAMAYDATIEGWSRAMDLRDKETAGHTQRVTDMTLELAKAMGMSTEELIHIRRGALLHDMGKLGVPDEVLLKPGKLTEEDWVAMRKHPQYAYDMFASIPYLLPALDIPYCHHEKWDGTGYPRGLKGEEIPLSARLFAVVDVWDALRSDRPYRASWPHTKVMDYIQSNAGTHFDPQAVELFLKLMSEKPYDSYHPN
jgi:HD-GYP domain-containing protein (c-di-GMP phosphodiesterase class II)